MSACLHLNQESQNEQLSNGVRQCRSNKLQGHWLEKLELQQGLRINYRGASGVSIMRLARRLRRTVRSDGARLHRDPVSVH